MPDVEQTANRRCYMCYRWLGVHMIAVQPVSKSCYDMQSSLGGVSN